ncbi:hypothetical protein C8Q79DRAFT_977041 [Trametes meyenii]|nr:hypothetical protein C8Q79DRAFT_977041 [Trametes meyenii]
MVSQPNGSDAIETPGRPHIILHTLPSLSFSTPTQSFNVRLSIRSPLDDKMATPHHAYRSAGSSSIDPGTLSESVKNLYDLIGGVSYRQDYMQRELDSMRKDVNEILQYIREQRARDARVAGASDLDFNSGHARRPSLSTPDLREGTGTGRRRRLLSAATTISHRAIDNIRSAFGRIQYDAHNAIQQLDEEENAMAEASGSLTQQQRAALLDSPYSGIELFKLFEGVVARPQPLAVQLATMRLPPLDV